MAYLIPRVLITVREEVVPPLPSGPGVLGVIGTIPQLKSSLAWMDEFTSQGDFFAKIIEKLNASAFLGKRKDELLEKSKKDEYQEQITSILEEIKQLEKLKTAQDEFDKVQEAYNKAQEAYNKAPNDEQAKKAKEEAEKKYKELKNTREKNQTMRDIQTAFYNSEEGIVCLVKSAFANGLSKLRVLLGQSKPSADDMEKFRADYPEIDMITKVGNDITPEDIAYYLNKCKDEAKPCMAFLGIDKNSDKTALATLSKNPFIVYVSPKEAIGAVIGKIASLPFYESPTFKPGLVYSDDTPLTTTEIEKLLSNANGVVLPVSRIPGKGWTVVKGVMSDGEEISVRRITNYVVRGVKSIGDAFIGQLNTAESRDALRQKIIEFLTRLEKDNALVPMEDLKTRLIKPAFNVIVSSSPSDFSLGIVKVEMQIRPVRAMNYIDVTINVQAT